MANFQSAKQLIKCAIRSILTIVASLLTCARRLWLNRSSLQNPKLYLDENMALYASRPVPT